MTYGQVFALILKIDRHADYGKVRIKKYHKIYIEFLKNIIENIKNSASFADYINASFGEKMYLN